MFHLSLSLVTGRSPPGTAVRYRLQEINPPVHTHAECVAFWGADRVTERQVCMGTMTESACGVCHSYAAIPTYSSVLSVQVRDTVCLPVTGHNYLITSLVRQPHSLIQG